MTSNAERLRELADRVAALTGPDREMDAAIAAALMVGHDPSGFKPECTFRYEAERDRAVMFVTYEGNERRVRSFVADLYTASLDAAMTLAGDYFKLEPDSVRGWRAVGLKGPCCHAATPALALTAAALRALSAKEGDGGGHQ